MASGMVSSTVIRAVKSSRKFVPQRAAIKLTPSAVSKVKELLSENTTAIGLRVGVRTRGCSGLTYTLDYATEKKKMDEEVVQDGARVLIDSKAQLSLLGTEMDFVENKLGSEFIFHNPNVKGTCGCGESFHV
ncbi:PREDICTED: iron-sulfur cluster assembly 1 homolog, mitochondrial-like [Amphimedon queenslandica]|nr:PREDICTED: iron-sulfur cluster assembly 1 homolog, mitochondrial-like [Amphimedon queenslandica]|eukprot:XP_003388382.1 PREDICTED: iron-sulfur cluster assembly 1 homolog, mitochondrial-like [Amphimedon queenslandica]